MSCLLAGSQRFFGRQQLSLAVLRIVNGTAGVSRNALSKDVANAVPYSGLISADLAGSHALYGLRIHVLAVRPNSEIKSATCCSAGASAPANI